MSHEPAPPAKPSGRSTAAENAAVSRALRLLASKALTQDQVDVLLKDPKKLLDFVRRRARTYQPLTHRRLSSDVGPVEIAELVKAVFDILSWLKSKRGATCKVPLPPKNKPCGAQMTWGVDKDGYMECIEGHRTLTPYREE